MATYAETKIKEALFDWLATLVFSPALPVAYPNSTFEKPPGSYLEAKMFPNRTRQATLGTTGLNRHIGFLQVNICWPQHAGEVAPTEVEGQLIAHFKRGTDITREGLIITIDEPPFASTGFNDPDNANRFTIPVTIPYRADVPNP